METFSSTEDQQTMVSELAVTVAGGSQPLEPSSSSAISLSASVTFVESEPSDDITGLNITTKRVIKPRSECKGGGGQLKLGNKTKTPYNEKERNERAIQRVKDKVGETVAEELLKKWEESLTEKDKKKRSSEGDGIIKTLKAIGLSVIEIRAFLKVGSSRISRVVENKPKPPSKTPKHAASDADTFMIVDFVLGLDLEPGYPCAHRSIPLYVEGEDQGSNWRKLHDKYKEKCLAKDVRIISYNRFREYVHHYFPTLKLGKTKTDMCNQCYNLNLKMNDPDTSPDEKELLKEKLSIHIGESSIQRRAMNSYIQLVKDKLAPNDPPLNVEPCRVEDINDDVLNEALNLNSINPVLRFTSSELFIEDEIEIDDHLPKDSQGRNFNGDPLVELSRDNMKNVQNDAVEAQDVVIVEAHEQLAEKVSSSETLKLSQKAKDSIKEALMKRSGNQRSTFSKTISEDISRNMDITIEDYGSEKPLPHYGLNRPNADYFNSSIHLRNMNIIDVSGGVSSIYVYDERSGGKDGNSVCSVRWEDLKIKHKKDIISKTKSAEHHVGIYDNCVGQNKSNLVFKFEMLLTILGFFKTKTKLFLLPGHSHNSSDVKTAELNRCLRAKNLYTPQEICRELQALKNAETFILENENFYDWGSFLDRYIKNMPLGFTSFYCFEISEGRVTMKKLCTETPENEVESKILVENVEATRVAILKELFDLPSDTTLDTIVNTPVRLPKLEVKPISEKRLKSIKKKYKVIPKEHIPYYPGGDEYLVNATDEADEESNDDAADTPARLDKPKKKVGRPKAKDPKKNISTPSILKFFKALPAIPKTADKKLE